MGHSNTLEGLLLIRL